MSLALDRVKGVAGVGHPFYIAPPPRSERVPVTIVDTHCHTGIHKYEPVEALLFHMERAGVDKAVLIQHAGETDNGYHIECLDRHPGRFVSAMVVEPEDDGSKIRAWAERGIIGIRLPIASRAQAADPLAQWRTAAELDLVVSAQSTPAALLSEDFAEVLAKFPELSIVIEHLAGVGNDAAPPYEDFTRVLALAEYPNLSIKLPGFGEFCALPHPFRDVPPLAEMAIDAFGPSRVMWGSDWPVCLLAADYNTVLDIALDAMGSMSDKDRHRFLSGSASEFYRISK